MKILAIQPALRPEIPHIFGNIDYKNFREALIKIDEILIKGRLEVQIIDAAIDQWLVSAEIDASEFMNTKDYPKLWNNHKFALRCNIARILTGESFRVFSVHLADSVLFQWFTQIHHLTNKKSISKSALERFDKMFDSNVIDDIIRRWQSEFLSSVHP